MTDPVNAPEHVPTTAEPEKDGVFKKLGKGLLWVFNKGAEYVSQYPRTAFAIIVILVATEVFV